MAVILTPTKRQITLRVIVGQTETGGNKLGSVSFSHVSPTLDVDAQKANIGTVTNALEYCLGVPTSSRQVTSTDLITDD